MFFYDFEFDHYSGTDMIESLKLQYRNFALDSAYNTAIREDITYRYMPELIINVSDYGQSRIQACTTVTLSFDYVVSGITTAVNIKPSFRHINSDGDRVYHLLSQGFDANVGTTYGHYSYTFTTDDISTLGDRIRFSDFGVGQNEGAVLEIGNLMLEESNEEHEWRAAPEDGGGIRLSDLGYTVCSFNGEDLETIDHGGELVFNTVSTHQGRKWDRTSSEYGSVLECTFQICKDDCATEYADMEITLDEFRTLQRWLHRVGFHEFRPYGDDNGSRVNYAKVNHGYVAPMWGWFHYDGSFTSINRIESEGKIVGLELTFTTNRPFAVYDDLVFEMELDADTTYSMDDLSDAEGFIYPYTVITIGNVSSSSAGELVITNSMEPDRRTAITGCTKGEVITLDYPMISSSLGDKRTAAIQDCFNWVFPRISNNFYERTNKFTLESASLNQTVNSCTVSMTYCPAVKISI